MRPHHWMSGLLLLSLLLLPPLASTAAAQEHIADPAAVRGAVLSVQATDEANRAIVLRALERDDVRRMADRFGVDIGKAASAVNGLGGAELAELAAPARAMAAQGGGNTTVVISVTTLLLLLILLVLLVK